MSAGRAVPAGWGGAVLRAVCLAVSLAAGATAGAACAPFIEEDRSGVTASLRADTGSPGPCRVDERAYRQLVAQWLRDRPTSAAPVTSLSLGRVMHYPWLSQHIAQAALQSPGWERRIAGVPANQRDRLAVFVFEDPLLLQRLAAPFEGTAYRVLGLRHEKLLFGAADVHAFDGAAAAVQVPFDAQLSLRLAVQN